MNILSWILFGLVVGILANAIDSSGKKMGLFSSMFLGLVGALVGGFSANLILGTRETGFNSVEFLIAIAGSLIVLFVSKSVRKAT